MKTNQGLVEHCKTALKEHWGYVWGTSGDILTQSAFNSQLNMYPREVGKYKDFIQNNWIGKKTVDCSGLIRSYIGSSGSSGSMYNMAKNKGLISSIPEVPGICLWKPGHVGVYIGNGQVIEAKGTKYGVVQTPLKGDKSTGWKNWFEHNRISYTDSDMTSQKNKKTEIVPDKDTGLYPYVPNEKDKNIYIDTNISSCSLETSRAKISLDNTLIGEPIYPDLLKVDEFKVFQLLNIKLDNYLNYEEDMFCEIDKEKLEKELGISLKDIFPIDEMIERQTSIDIDKLKKEKKSPNNGGPINAKDPFPVDNKIEELEVHDPKVKIEKLDIPCVSNGAIAGDVAVGKAVVDLAAKTEQRLVNIENNLSTVMRYLFGLSSRININCVYYGGQCKGDKYNCIRCMNDDLINDGALVSIDRCLTCDRYEPILGQVYDILEDGSVDLNAITDSLQSGYMTMEEYIDLVNYQNMHNEQDKGNTLEAKPQKIDFLNGKWAGKDWHMDWDYTPINTQDPDINWFGNNKSEYSGPTQTKMSTNESDDIDLSYIETNVSLDNNKNPNFARPLKSYRVSSEFGYRIHPTKGGRKLHAGIDLAIGSGTPIYSSTNGKIVYAGWYGGGGNTVIIQSGNYFIKYMHQPSLEVKVGQEVKQGQYIGKVGKTGSCTGAHLHFEIRKGGIDGTPINPRKLVNL